LYGENHIAENSVIVTDSCASYILLAEELKSELIQVPSGEHSNGEYNIQRVNSFHTSFMTLINRKHRGVSSKHVNGYLAWCAFKFKTKITKLKNKIIRSFGDTFSITTKVIGGLDILPVLV
jgi:transposase-like protein